MPSTSSRTFRFLRAALIAAFVVHSAWAAAVELPLRINAGGPPIGKPGDPAHWVSDRDFVNGGDRFRFGSGHDTRDVTSPGPKEIYRTVRHQDHDYRIDGLPEGDYLVRFHFTDGTPSGGRRAMDYRINGKLVIEDLNVRRTAGGTNRVHIIEVETTIKAGRPLRIECRKDTGNDVFEAGIEILPKDPAMAKATSETPPLVAKPIAPPSSPSPRPPARGPAAEIRKFTGAQTRFVWLQAHSGHHFITAKDRAVLMGLDTDDGLGERQILPGEAAYSKALFTPDGEGIVFSDRKERRVYLMNWDGTGRRDLGRGFASDVWRDPQSGEDWIYLRSGDGRSDDPIIRRRLDQPEIEEKVWARTKNGQDAVPWFQLSADGRKFADAFPWSHCGAGDLIKGEWKRYTGGCWPGMAPDNSYRAYIFSGNHAHITVFDDGGRNERKVDLSGIPGHKGKKVYFPRWSNDVRFLTVSSPEMSPKANLYLGQFDREFESIERWVQVTRNGRADLYGDAWINPSAGTPSEAIMERPTDTMENLPDVTSADLNSEWPGTSEGLVWIWKNGNAQNEAPARDDDSNPFACSGTLQGQARFGPHFQVFLDGGSFAATNEAGGRISKAIQSSGAFTIETLVTTFDDDQKGPARILSLSKNAGERNFTLGQEGDWLVLRFRTGPRDTNGTKQEARLFRLVPGTTDHVLLTHRPGELVGYRNGKEILRSRPDTDLGSWASMPLILGDEVGGGRNWKGSLESVAFFDRFIGPEEAAGHARLAMAPLEERKPAPQTVVSARLVESTPVPTLQAMGTYRRALVENVYEVTKVISGSPLPADTERIIVRQWAVMDRKPVPSAAKRKTGGTFKLHLEPAAAHPEVEPDFLSSDHGEFEAPVYFDVESHR